MFMLIPILMNGFSHVYLLFLYSFIEQLKNQLITKRNLSNASFANLSVKPAKRPIGPSCNDSRSLIMRIWMSLILVICIKVSDYSMTFISASIHMHTLVFILTPSQVKKLQAAPQKAHSRNWLQVNTDIPFSREREMNCKSMKELYKTRNQRDGRIRQKY